MDWANMKPCHTPAQIQYIFTFNSSWPSVAIWRQISWLSLAQIMACCLTAINHYLYQYWFITKGVVWYSPKSNFTRIAHDIYHQHYGDIIMGAIASQITSLTIVYSTVYSDADKKNPSKLRVTGLCAGNPPHKWPVTRKKFLFDDVIMSMCSDTALWK